MRLSPAIARIAGWPIEIADGLRSPLLASGVDLWLRDQELIRQRARRLSEMLHAAVPRIRDKQVRAGVLRLRRSIHNSADRLPEPELNCALASKELAVHEIEELRTEAAVRLSLIERRTALEKAYAVAIGAELRALRELANSPEFLKALYLSSPSAFDACMHEPGHTEIRKIHCRILSYIMRAIGRCTPNALWSGVALESDSAAAAHGVTVAPGVRKVQFSPSLDIFVPSLRAAQGDTRERVLPGIFTSAWEALGKAVDELPPAETPRWRNTIKALHTIATQLESSFGEISLGDLRRLMDAARETVNALAGCYGVKPVGTDVHVLIADATAPFSFRLGDRVRSFLAQRLHEYWQFDRHGYGEVLARQHRERVFRMIDRASGMRFSDWVEAFGDNAPGGTSDAAEDAILQRWHDELEPVYSNHTHLVKRSAAAYSPLPHGSALLRLDVSGRHLELRIGAVTPDPCLFYSRFHTLFRAEDCFTRWYRAELDRIETRTGVMRFADLAAYSPVDANASVRPRLHDHVVDLAYDRTLAANSRIELEPRGRPRWIHSDGCVIVPLLHSAVALDDADRGAACLHQISHLLGRPSLMRPLPHFPREQEVWGHLPRICLGADTVISPERWTASAEAMAELADSTGLERFIRWRRLVATLELPDAVYYKHYRAETELLMYTDSVLAVENLGRTVATYPAVVGMQEVIPSLEESWVRDSYGRHYAAEIAIAWGGEDEFWIDYAGAACEGPAAASVGVGGET